MLYVYDTVLLKIFESRVSRVFMLSFLFISLAVFSSIISGPAYCETAETELESVEESIYEQQELISKIKEEERSILEELEYLDRSLENNRLEKAQVEEQIIEKEKVQVEIEAELLIAQEELSDVEQEFSEKKDVFNQRLRQIYKYGLTGYLELIIGAQGWTDLINRLSYLQLVIDYDARLIQEIEKQKKFIEKRRLGIKNKEEELKRQIDEFYRLKDILSSKEAEIDEKKAQREQVLTQVQDKRESYEQSLAELQVISRRLEEEIRRVQEDKPSRADDSPQERESQTGVMEWPTTSTRITSDFGWRTHPIHGSRSFHDGIDIAADHGEPVYAAEAGWIIYSGWAQGYGLTVIIDHGEGISSLYAHLSEILVSSGSYIERGQIAGRIGTTGYSTGPHLHFEIRRFGKPIDPMPFFE